MKTVLHITYSRKFGGAETVISYIVSHTSKEYRHILLSPNGSIQKELDEKGIECIHYSYSSLFVLFCKLNSLDYDLLIAHDYRAILWTGLFRPIKKKLAWLHSPRPFLNTKSLWTILLEIVLRVSFSKLVFVSDTMYKQVRFSENVKSKSLVLQNVIDESSVVESANKFLTSKSDLLYLGRFSPEKNPLKFIQIVHHLAVDNPNIKAIMLGDGILRKDCENYIQKYDLQSNISIEGYQNNPYPYLIKNKILVMTSHYESVGMAALESLALKNVVIMPSASISKDFEGQGIFCCKDISEYIKRITDLLSNEQYFNKQKQEARQSFIKMNNQDLYNRELCDLLKKQI